MIAAPATQILGGTIYQFAGWSDGYSAPQRVVTTPSTDMGFLALYQDVGIVPPVTVVGCQPASLDEGIGLSPAVAASIDDAVRAVLELVQEGGSIRVPGDSGTGARALR